LKLNFKKKKKKKKKKKNKNKKKKKKKKKKNNNKSDIYKKKKLIYFLYLLNKFYNLNWKVSDILRVVKLKLLLVIYPNKNLRNSTKIKTKNFVKYNWNYK